MHARGSYFPTSGSAGAGAGGGGSAAWASSSARWAADASPDGAVAIADEDAAPSALPAPGGSMVSAETLDEELCMISATVRDALSGKPLEEVRAAFRAVDDRGQGKLSAAQVAAALSRLRITGVSQLAIAQLVEAFDVGEDDRLNVDECMDWLSALAVSGADTADATTRLRNRIRGVLMAAGDDALRDLFLDPASDSTALVSISIETLADRLDALGLSDVDDAELLRMVRAMDASNDGMVTYGELNNFLKQRAFAQHVTRVMHRAAATLVKRQTSLQEMLEVVALRAGTADMNANHAEKPVVLSQAMLRHVLVELIGVPLTDEEVTALMTFADIDGDGTCDVVEVLACAGESYDWELGEDMRDAIAREMVMGEPAMPGYPPDLTNPPRLVFGAAGEAAAAAAAAASAIALQAPTSSYTSSGSGDVAVPLVSGTSLGLTAVGGAGTLRSESAGSASQAAAGEGAGDDTPVVIEICTCGIDGAENVAVPTASLPPAAGAVPLSLPRATVLGDDIWGVPATATLAQLMAQGPPCHVGTGVSVYAHPLEGDFAGAPTSTFLWRQHATVASGASRLPCTPWPYIVESAFVAFASAGAMPTPANGATAIAGPVTMATPPAAAVPAFAAGAAATGPNAALLASLAGRTSTALTLDMRRVPQALAAIGLAVHQPLAFYLTQRADNGTRLLDVSGWARLVDDLVHTQLWQAGRCSLFPIAEGRIRTALATAPNVLVNGALTTATSDSWPVATAALMHRHTLAYALATRCSLSGITLDEAISLAAWAPGRGQALASAAVLKTAASLTRHGRISVAGAADWGVVVPPSASTAAAATAAARRGGDAGDGKADGDESASAGSPPSSLDDASSFIMHGATASVLTAITHSGGNTAAPTPGSALPFVVGPAAGASDSVRRGSGTGVAFSGRRGSSTVTSALPPPPPPTSVIIRALAAAATADGDPDISVSALIMWLRTMASCGVGLEAAASMAPPAPGASSPSATTSEFAVGTNAYMYTVLPPLARSGVRKLCGMALALPLPPSCINVTTMTIASASAPGTPSIPGAGTGLPPMPLPGGLPFTTDGSTFALSGASTSPLPVATYALSSLLASAAARWPATFHPSRLAPLVFGHPATTFAAQLLDGGWEADPGRLLANRTGSVTAAAAIAAAGGTVGVAGAVPGPTVPTSTPGSTAHARRGSGGGVTPGASLVAIGAVPSMSPPSAPIGLGVGAVSTSGATASALSVGAPPRPFGAPPMVATPASSASATTSPSAGGAGAGVLGGLGSPSGADVTAEALAGAVVTSTATALRMASGHAGGVGAVGTRRRIELGAGGSAPSAATPGSVGSELAWAAVGGDVHAGHPYASPADGYGLALRWSSLVPGALIRSTSWLGSSPPPSPTDALPKLRPVGAFMPGTTDASWASEGVLVRPEVVTVVLDLVSALGVPCPPDDALRACIAARVVRVALIDVEAEGGGGGAGGSEALRLGRFRLLSNGCATVATWTHVSEDAWTIPPAPGNAAARLVIRSDAPRDAGGPSRALLLFELNIVVTSPPGAATATAASGSASGAAVTSSGPTTVVGDAYAFEEVTCAWGAVPLAVLAGQPKMHRIKLEGGSLGASVPVAPGDIMQRRTGFSALAKAFSSAITVPELVVVSRPLSRLSALERQGLAALPLTVLVPSSYATVLEVWRKALAQTLLQTSRSHKPAAHAPLLAPPLPVLVAATRILTAGGTSSTALAALSRAWDVEWAAAQKLRPVPPAEIVLGGLLYKCLVAMKVEAIGLGVDPLPVPPLASMGGAGVGPRALVGPIEARMGDWVTRWVGVAAEAALVDANIVFKPATAWDELV